jgi:hypothetical protein
MAKSYFNPENKDVIDELMLSMPDVEPGKAFGYPAYYINGKMFACIYEDGVAIKMPEDLVGRLLEKTFVSEFRPMNRHTMKQWVLISHENPEDFREDMDLFNTSMEYVYLLSKEARS